MFTRINLINVCLIFNLIIFLSACSETVEKQRPKDDPGAPQLKSSSTTETFQGVTYSPLGNAQLHNYGDSLVVSNLDGGADDGYSVELNGYSGWHEDFKPLYLPDGSATYIKGVKEGGEPATELRAKNINDEKYKISFRHNLEVSHVTLVGYRDNQKVFSKEIGIDATDGYEDVGEMYNPEDKGGLFGGGKICDIKWYRECAKCEEKIEISFCDGLLGIKVYNGNKYNDIDYVQIHVNGSSYQPENPKVIMEDVETSIIESNYLN